MNHLPIFVKLNQQPCLVVGGGTVAARKVGLLRRAGARVTVVAPKLGGELCALRERGEIDHRKGFFEARHVTGQRLVIAATGDEGINETVSAAAEAAGIFCNVVDNNEASGFILPAIVDRSPVIIAVGTGGHAPVLAQRLKSKIEAWLPARIGELAETAGHWRERVKERFATLTGRRRFWQAFFEGPIAEHILASRGQAAEQLINGVLAEGEQSLPGEAYIVGAGPGDPGLVTLRAQQLISQADVILFDRLVSSEVLDYARKEADLISVGKKPGDAPDRQQWINDLLVRLVGEGKRVCRLKGGDPFVFGRGGEEAEALADAGLPYQIVPGVSAALACAAYAGIPLTMRGMSGSVTLASARLEGTRSVDWRVLARSGQTLALYMSIGSLGESTEQLMRHGLPGITPAAIVQNGSSDRQRVLHSVLERLPGEAEAAGIEAPAMLFVGEAVALGRKLGWFEGATVTADVTTGTGEEIPAERQRVIVHNQ